MVRAYERWRRLRRLDSPEGYVYVTAINLHRSRLRRLALRNRLRLLVRRPPDPMESIEMRTDLVDALRALPDGQRDALLLVEWLDLSAESAGHALGIAPASIRSRTHRARRALRDQLDIPDD